MSEHTLTAGDPAQPPSREHKPKHEAGAIPHAPAAASTRSGWTLPCLERHPHRHGYVGDDALTARVAKARATFAWKQLMRCFPKYGRLSDALDRQAIERLADNQPTDPNHPETWRSVYQHATAVLRRHAITNMTDRLTYEAQKALIAGQAQLDREAGIDWSVLHQPLTRLDDMLRRAHHALPLDLDDPQVWMYNEDRRRAGARKLGVSDHQADDLSRWALANPDKFDPADLRCWRIGSATWLELANDVLAAVEHVDRPVAAFVVPEIRTTRAARESDTASSGWQLQPTLSLDLIRLVYSLGGSVHRDLHSARLPGEAIPEFINAVNHNTLHAGPKENLDSAKQLSEDLSRALGVTINPGIPKDRRDRWGRLLIHRERYEGKGQATAIDELSLRVITYPAKGFQTRRLGNRPRDQHASCACSAAMELGEAIQAAVERNLPLLLSTEAAGLLHGVVRVGRLKGRPGMLSITTSDGLSAITRRMVAEQAVCELRRLRRLDAKVSIDAGAKQVIRMTVARPLTDDPILKGRQQEVAARMVVGAGVNASQTGAGKCVSGNARVFANGELVAIEELWERYAGSLQRFDGEGYWAELTDTLTINSVDRWGRIVPAQATRLYRQHVHERGRTVTLDDGSTVTITDAHQLLGVDGWTVDIKPGDPVCVPGVLRWDGAPLDHDLVALVAWQIAEGHEPAGNRGQTMLRITQKDRKVLERLRAASEAVGRRHGLRMNSMPITQPAGKAAVLAISSASYRRFLERELTYAWGRKSADKRIPDRIVAADDATMAVFLRAFFDAEGSVSADRGRVEVTSASRELIDQVAVMLRRFGIWLRIARKEKSATNGSGNRRTYWTGYIGGPSLRRFAEHVGFTAPAKSARLALVCQTETNSNVEGVPVADLVAEVKAAGGTYHIAQPADQVSGATVGHARGAAMLRGYRTTADLTHDRAAQVTLDPRVRKTIRTLDAQAVQDVADCRHERLAREAFYAKVVSVEDTQLDGWVYDLEVAEHHNFVAGGLLAHNTIMSGRTLYHRAATTKRFRAIVVAEGRLLSQWQSELEHGAPGRGLAALAPNTRVVIVDDRSSVAAQIRGADRAAGDSAVVFLVANSILDRYVADLQAIDYHLLIADEAQRYVNPATEAHIALKQLRLGSVIDCWLLTATPKGKSAEDLDVLVGLSVGDEAMIRERLNSRESADLMDEVNAHRLRVNFGPHLLRVTRQDMKAWMPEVRPAQPLAIDADSALAELLDAVRAGGREAYRRLLQVLRELKTAEQGSALYKQALVEMSRAQATVLSNVNVFVDLSVDPETALHSHAALAQALCEQGLVAEAMRGGGDGLPLLRAITAQTIAGVVGEEQVIVFAERNWCLRQLAGTLRERHGVDARVADGTLTTDEFEAIKHDFVDERFPVLCLSKVGQEGHNFQNASVLVHLDLPWTQKPLEQRVGRAARPGSKTGYVQTYIPYIRRGGIEHVVSILAERGAEHHQVLDSFEGVRAADSTVANQLGAITKAVADSKDDAGFATTAARLRVAASVFGH